MDSLEYRKTIPVYGEYDVIVAGAGAAGICAAVAAARQGARVCLVERYGVLGGNLTVGFVGPILGMVSKGTMRDELMSLLGVPENDMLGWIGVAHDFEKAKRVIADFVDIDNLTVLMQSPAVDVIKEGNRVKGLLISGNDGLKAIYGKVVIDSTGDGDISFLAGAETMKGRSDGLCQPVSLEFTIGNVDESRAVVCIGDVDDVKLGDEPFLEYCRRCAENRELPPELAAVRLHRTVTPGQRQVNTTQLNRIDGTDTASLFRAEAALRRQIGIITEFLRSHLPGYEDCLVISSGATLGVRESRRVRGEYVLTREDVVDGARFPDVAVHKAEFIVDIHNPAGAGQAEATIQYCTPYDIPYRCFVPLGVDGLLTAGRCISGTHDAHASYRVMSICLAMGEAAGVAAAIAAEQDALPRDLDVSLLQQRLIEKGVDLFSE